MNASTTDDRKLTKPMPSAVPNGSGSWAEQNQRWLVWALDALRRRIDPKGVDASPPAKKAAVDTPPTGFTPALDLCARLFGLSQFERELVLAATGLELHRGMRDSVASLNGGAQAVSFGWAMTALREPHWDALSPDAPLRAWDLVHVEPNTPLSQALLRVDERIVHYITGVPATDLRLRGVADFLETAGLPLDDRDDALVQRLSDVLSAKGAVQPVLVLRTDANDAAAARSIMLSALARYSMPALVIASQHLPADPNDLADTVRRVDREAALTGAVPVLLVDDSASERSATAFVARLRSLVLVGGAAASSLSLASTGRRVARVDLPRPDGAHSSGLLRALRRQSTNASPDDPTIVEALEHAAAQFDPPSDALDDIVSRVRAAAPAERRAEAWSASREASRGGLDALAQRIDSTARFDDLVLPPAQLSALRDIARQLRHRERVFREWGFGERHARGQGLTALFAGESGTGKTLAAEVIANEVELDLYRVDLATVVSKYIGETEKNLKRVFDAAEASGAVLLFDEADAIFGKRSEVKDSHDRYANIEVAYLLQRVESYRGLAILTTNMKSALDRAFLRRLRFVIHFPFPDPKAREQIWRREFPTAAPMGTVDFAALGKLNVSGGSIHSIVLNAAFKAADAGGVIDQETLMAAARAELAKLERPFGQAAERA